MDFLLPRSLQVLKNWLWSGNSPSSTRYTPLPDFAFWGLSLLPTVIFWNFFLGLGTISNFHNNCSAEDSRFFSVLRDKYSPLAISYPNIIMEANKEKELFAAGNSAEVEEKTRRAPMKLQKFNWLQWCLRLVISHGRAAESTSVWGVQDKIWHKCFSLVDDLPFGNDSWNHPGVTWKLEQMLADRQLNIFSLAGPIEFPEVPGNNTDCTGIDKMCIFPEGKEMAPRQQL